MPSSLIFAGLVVLWLLILVPAVARRQQEVVRPSEAALSGRVLARPVRNRTLEVYGMDTDDERDEPRGGAVATRTGSTASVPAARDGDSGPDPELRDERPDLDDLDRDDEIDDVDDVEAAEDYADEPEVDDAEDLDDIEALDELDEIDELDEGDRPVAEERRWERPPAAFRPGRGGFDAEAAALAARARYGFRQRVVVGLLVLAVVTAGVALFASAAFWWVHGLVDLALVGYLAYLRRQVRMEESIRARRAARMAGTRRASAADDPELDEWARKGQEAGAYEADELEYDDEYSDESDADDPEDWTADDGEPERVRGTGEPIGVLPARRRTVGEAPDDSFEPALPRLEPAPPPPLPAGTQLVDVDEDEDELAVGTGRPATAYRRAVGE
ncbi:hypothetical protein GCM10009836_20720 [Pseudonocardia ailaonensis]|uniref:Transmembrane protein n=1 Tax=Pseudonocardia ailaonensis TaxID=367279 RepID=A0ABN2MWN3_9PSEU